MSVEAVLARLRAKYPGRYDHVRPGGGGAVALPVVRHCRHEGDVVEWCTKCGAEARHVRQCNHDDGPDKCVRGESRNPDVRSCGRCPLREVNDDAH